MQKKTKKQNTKDLSLLEEWEYQRISLIQILKNDRFYTKYVFVV